MNLHNPHIFRHLKAIGLLIFIVGFSDSAIYAQSWELRDILKAPLQQVNDYFGTYVAINGEYAAVSGAITTGEQKAPVYIFKRTDNNYVVTQLIKGTDEDPISAGSIAMSEEYLVIGQPTTLGLGRAYIYKKDTNGAWNQVQIIQSSDNHGLDKFGTTVAVSGNTIVVSSPGKSIEYYEGAIYIFELDPQTGMWSEKQKIMSSDSQRDDYFGYSLAIDGDHLIAGSPFEDDSNIEHSGYGAAYYFLRNENGVWEEKQKLVAPQRTTYSNFGWSIDMDNDDAIIGAKGDEFYGAAYIFKRQDGVYMFSQRVSSPFDYGFGHDVAVSNGLVVVSSDSHMAQYAFTYKKSPSGQWETMPKIYSPRFHVSYESESFGKAIDFDKGRLIIGAPHAIASTGTDYDPPSAGEALVYEASEKPIPFQKVDWITEYGRGKFPKLADFDNDGDLDLLIGYNEGDGVNETRLYRFTDNQYHVIDQRFPALEYYSDAAWLDVNGDGWLDFILRYEENYKGKTQLYLNNAGTDFQSKDVSDQLMADKWYGRFHFGDYDNDGDEDLLVQRKVEYDEKPLVQLLANNGKFVFTETQFNFEGNITSSQPWFDFDNDGDKDFVINQEIACDQSLLVPYRNENGERFQKVTTGISTVNAFWQVAHQNGDVVWGDVDNDGDGDIIWSGITGCSSGDGGNNVAINIGGFFTQGNMPFKTYLGDVHLSATDINNDGVLDMVPYGNAESGRPEMTFFLGSKTSFSKLQLYEMPTSYQDGGTATGDIEGDGDVDVLIAGNAKVQTPEIMVYRNNAAEGWATKNQPPAIPLNLQAASNERTVTLTWDRSSDDTTPQSALTYNVTLMRNDSIIICSYSNSNGSRQYYRHGNVGHSLRYHLKDLKDGIYKVAIQAIDNAYAGSAFSQYVEFQIPGIVLATEKATDAEVNIFPNPAQDKLIIENQSDVIDQLQIYSMHGGVIQSQSGIKAHIVTLDVSRLEPAIYFVAIQTKRGRMVKRIVKK